MSQNRFSLPLSLSKQLSISRPHTIGVVASPVHQDTGDDDDNDICPVCDGECTCHITHQPPLVHHQSHPPLFSSAGVSTTSAAAHAQHVFTTMPAKSKQKLPTLKIKLTVPPNLLGSRRGPTANSNGSATACQLRDPSSSPPNSPTPLPSNHQYAKSTSITKRRGRPPKSVSAARQISAVNAPTSHRPHVPVTLSSMSLPSRSVTRHPNRKPGTKQKTRSSVSRLTSLKASNLKRVPSRRKPHYADSSDDDTDSSSELSQIDDDTESGQFPTFVSASALSSLDDSPSSRSSGSSLSSPSSSDSSEPSDFETDASIEAEEESFILAQESRGHDKARIRRELLGEDAHRRRDAHHNDWVIRPRKRSVGLSDVEMDADSDATEEAVGHEEQDEEDCAEDDEEETDDRSTSRGFASLVTGWSEDEESSFDADLFFANLSSDSTDDNSSSLSDDEGGEDGDQSDLDTMSSEAALSGFLPPRENLPFEVTEGWDGRIIFTNGLSDNQGLTDLNLEIEAAQLFVQAAPSPSPDTDVEMATEVDEDGYEQDEDEGEGDTTDEELVGEDDLPNERAMRLFHLPFSVSAIDPMSTMSPAASPSPRDRKPFGSPKPGDILAGKTFWDSDGEAADDTTHSQRSSSSHAGLPRTGVFEGNPDVHQVIIDGVNKNIPSPHPRFPGRGRTITRSARNNGDNHQRRQPSKLSIVTSPGFDLMSPSDVGVTSPVFPAEPIDLDDVLEASFLDSDPFDTQDGASSTTFGNRNDGAEDGNTTSTSFLNENESRKLESTPNRWDHISVGGFRNSRESGSITDSPSWTPGAATTNYESMMKPSPLSPMLWQNKPTGKKAKRKHIISPVILPLHDEDECTPTSTPTVTPLSTPVPFSKKQNHNYNHNGKTRRELRRERKLKRKSYGPTHHHHQHYQHHHHHHYPNTKSRCTASVQRNYSSSSSIPSLNI
ncbi:hypothetical protein AX16_001366 [Volvariella volvacea WC 439]|nr:hypothetical protein AX16_001366 [Volvariella volvacea WC 439]